jgi:hypothetical protein
MAAIPVNSVPLLTVVITGICTVLTSYVVSWRAMVPGQRAMLEGSPDCCGPTVIGVAMVISPLAAALSFIYSAVFYLTPQLFVPANATILGLQWTGGGELLVCCLYGALLLLSSLWLPLCVRAVRGSSRMGPVLLVLFGVATAAITLAVVGMLLPQEAAPFASGLVLQR